MLSSVRCFFLGLFLFVAALPVRELGVKNASAGTGYIDAQGKWHFSVVLVQPPAPATPIEAARWIRILEAADQLLYRATNGKHQFGAVTLASKTHYDALADIIIWSGANLSRADVYGIGRLGYHVFMSDLLLTRMSPPPLSEAEVAKILIHELGHYFYALYDEYIPRPPDTTSTRCIDHNIKKAKIDQAACLMESCNPCSNPVGTWCFIENHEVTAGNNRTSNTWQSQDNIGMSCWEKIIDLYEIFNEPPNRPLEPEMVDMQGFVPLPPPLERSERTELVVAIDASISPGADVEKVLLQILDRALASNPQPAGDVVLLRYNKTMIQSTPALSWDKNLASQYRSHLSSIQIPSEPGADLTNLLQRVLAEFENFSAGAAGISRTFLLLTTGSENPRAPADRALFEMFRSQNIRSSIGFTKSLKSLPVDMLLPYGLMALGIGGTILDVTLPSVTAFQSAITADKQIVYLRTRKIGSPGAFTETAFVIPDMIAESLVSVSWQDNACGVDVTIQDSPVTGSNENDIVLPTLKAKRLFNLTAGTRVEIKVTVPPDCKPNPLPVTFSLSDERPTIYLTATVERPRYGEKDNQVVHARVTAPYPLVNLRDFVTSEADSLGEFIKALIDSTADDGVDQIRKVDFSGDWITKDGIYSTILKPGLVGAFRTVRFLVTNSGQASFAPGEAFSNNSSSSFRIPNFRREAFATYFVERFNTNLKLNFLKLDSLPWPPRIANIRRLMLTGSFALPVEYPHAFTILGEILGAKMAITGNKFQIRVRDIRGLTKIPPRIPTFEQLRDSTSFKVVFRTGDSLLVKGQIPFVK